MRSSSVLLFSFNDTPPTDIYTLSLHDALPIYAMRAGMMITVRWFAAIAGPQPEILSQAPSAYTGCQKRGKPAISAPPRSEEHTSELQSRRDLVCRLLLEKKNKKLHPLGPILHS